MKKIVCFILTISLICMTSVFALGETKTNSCSKYQYRNINVFCQEDGETHVCTVNTAIGRSYFSVVYATGGNPTSATYLYSSASPTRFSTSASMSDPVIGNLTMQSSYLWTVSASNFTIGSYYYTNAFVTTLSQLSNTNNFTVYGSTTYASVTNQSMTLYIQSLH